MRRLKNATLEERLFFHRIIDKTTGCWLWTAQKTKFGHGRITIDGKKKKVHRVSFELFVKKPQEMVLHKRECPYRHCFNPEHLYEGNESDNSYDREFMKRKGNAHTTSTI